MSALHIELDNVCVGIHQDGVNQALLCDVSLCIQQGQIHQWIGHNGIGKTRLLNTLAGVCSPISGRIHAHENVMLIGHEPCLKPWLSVAQSVRLSTLAFCSGALENYISQIDEGLQRLALHTIKTQRVQHLSHGQKKKINLVRLWTSREPVWLLDEPFSGLDANAIQVICQQINAHVARGGSVIFTHHTVNDVTSSALPLNDVRVLDLSEYKVSHRV